MDLEDKDIRIGNFGHSNYYPSEVCLMVTLCRLAYPCRFADLVEEFGISSNRLCDIFHATIDLIYAKYSSLLLLETWIPYFDLFAEVMRSYGSPYTDLVGLIDSLR